MNRRWLGLSGFFLYLLIIPWMRLPGVKRLRMGITFRFGRPGADRTMLKVTSNTSGLDWLSSNVSGIRIVKWRQTKPNEWIRSECEVWDSLVAVQKPSMQEAKIAFVNSEIVSLLLEAQGTYEIFYGNVDYVDKFYIEGIGNGVWEIIEWEKCLGNREKKR